MKKNYLIFIAFLLITKLSAQNIDGKVFYVTSLKKFSKEQADSLLNNQKTPKAARVHIRKMLMNTKDVTSVLEFSKNESLYKVQDKMINGARKGMNITSTIAGKNNAYYINIAEKDYFKQLNVDDFLRIDLLENKWEITQESKKIGNYQCFKAIALKKERKGKPSIIITAWFSPTIPVSFGPKNFFGLPGLILEVSYKKVNIRASKIILNPKEKIVIKKPKKGKRMSHKEYEEMNRNFFKGLR